MREQMRIDSIAGARVFASPRQRRLLLYLMAREHSSQELSRATGMALNLLHYHIGNLQRLQLIELTRRAARKGRPVNYYRAVARSYFIPACLASNTGTFRQVVQAALDASRARNIDEGTLYDVTADGKLRMRKLESSRRHGSAELLRQLRLTDAEAAVLNAELKALLTRFDQSRDKRRHSYLLYCVLTPGK